jgi:hypothetical protein
MKNSALGQDNSPNDWIIKICDYGLARSLAGVTSAKLISDVMTGQTPRKRKESDFDDLSTKTQTPI